MFPLKSGRNNTVLRNVLNVVDVGRLVVLVVGILIGLAPHSLIDTDGLRVVTGVDSRISFNEREDILQHSLPVISSSGTNQAILSARLYSLCYKGYGSPRRLDRNFTRLVSTATRSLWVVYPILSVYAANNDVDIVFTSALRSVAYQDKVNKIRKQQVKRSAHLKARALDFTILNQPEATIRYHLAAIARLMDAMPYLRVVHETTGYADHDDHIHVEIIL
jgi:hypothetical protein